jgi:hypothetical protein
LKGQVNNTLFCDIAVQGVARSQKVREEKLSWLKAQAEHGENWWGRTPALRELLRGWRGDLDILQFVKAHGLDGEGYVDDQVVQELATRWRHLPETHALIRTWAEAAYSGRT